MTFLAFYKGKSFKTVEEMVEYAKSWPDLPADLEYWQEFFKDRLMEIIMNSNTTENFTNKMAQILLCQCKEMKDG